VHIPVPRSLSDGKWSSADSISGTELGRSIIGSLMLLAASPPLSNGFTTGIVGLSMGQVNLGRLSAFVPGRDVFLSINTIH